MGPPVASHSADQDARAQRGGATGSGHAGHRTPTSDPSGLYLTCPGICTQEALTKRFSKTGGLQGVLYRGTKWPLARESQLHWRGGLPLGGPSLSICPVPPVPVLDALLFPLHPCCPPLHLPLRLPLPAPPASQRTKHPAGSRRFPRTGLCPSSHHVPLLQPVPDASLIAPLLCSNPPTLPRVLSHSKERPASPR